MTDQSPDRLIALLHDALAEADRRGDTLLGALIADCIATASRDASPPEA